MSEYILENQEVITLVNLDQCRHRTQNQPEPQQSARVAKERATEKAPDTCQPLAILHFCTIHSICLVTFTLFRGQNYANST